MVVQTNCRIRPHHSSHTGVLYHPARSRCCSTNWFHLQVVRATFGAVAKDKTPWPRFAPHGAVSTPVLYRSKDGWSAAMAIDLGC